MKKSKIQDPKILQKLKNLKISEWPINPSTQSVFTYSKTTMETHKNLWILFKLAIKTAQQRQRSAGKQDNAENNGNLCRDLGMRLI